MKTLQAMILAAGVLAGCGSEATVFGDFPDGGGGSGPEGGSSPDGGGPEGGSGSSTATGGSGGQGGTGTGTGTGTGAGGTAAGTGGGGSEQCPGPFSSVCEESACYVETDCGAGGLMAAIANQYLEVDFNQCDTTPSECMADCLGNSSCQNVQSLTTSNPDPGLQGCVDACQGGCIPCLHNQCSSEVQACEDDFTCEPMLDCGWACPDNDTNCWLACEAMSPGATSQALITCLEVQCQGPC